MSCLVCLFISSLIDTCNVDISIHLSIDSTTLYLSISNQDTFYFPLIAPVLMRNFLAAFKALMSSSGYSLAPVEGFLNREEKKDALPSSSYKK